MGIESETTKSCVICGAWRLKVKSARGLKVRMQIFLGLLGFGS